MSASAWRASRPPNSPRFWIARRCRSGCDSPRAMRATISRAFGEPLWHSTKSARSWSLRDDGPCRNFSSSGIACSGSEFMSPLRAISFRSSSATFSGRGGWPARCLISSSSAYASLSQRLCG